MSQILFQGKQRDLSTVGSFFLHSSAKRKPKKREWFFWTSFKPKTSKQGFFHFLFFDVFFRRKKRIENSKNKYNRRAWPRRINAQAYLKKRKRKIKDPKHLRTIVPPREHVAQRLFETLNKCYSERKSIYWISEAEVNPWNIIRHNLGLCRELFDSTWKNVRDSAATRMVN